MDGQCEQSTVYGYSGERSNVQGGFNMCVRQTVNGGGNLGMSYTVYNCNGGVVRGKYWYKVRDCTGSDWIVGGPLFFAEE